MNTLNIKEYHTFFTTPSFAMGQDIRGESGLRVNEVATRARAGLLNVLSLLTMVILIFKPELDPIIYVGPFVIFDMTAAALFGLTPLSPMGLLGTAITIKIKPLWKPSKPKRFAWILGALLGVTCLTFRLYGLPDAWILGVLGVCFALTWLEAVLGFCVGCWMHSLFFGCEVCELNQASN
jgi:predicted outer membrane lipoprotein